MVASVRVDLQRILAVLQRVLESLGAERQPPRFSHRDERSVEMLGDGRAEQEASTLYRYDVRNLRVGVYLRHSSSAKLE